MNTSESNSMIIDSSEHTYCLIPNLTPTSLNNLKDIDQSEQKNDLSFFSSNQQRMSIVPTQEDLMSFTINEDNSIIQSNLTNSPNSSVYDAINVYTNDQEFKDFVKETFRMYDVIKKSIETDTKLSNQDQELFKAHNSKINRFKNRFSDSDHVKNELAIEKNKYEQYQIEVEHLKTVNSKQESVVNNLKKVNDDLMRKISELEQIRIPKTMQEKVVVDNDVVNLLKLENQDLKVKYQGTKQHLDNLELAFCDIHRKYEKAKSVLIEFEHSQNMYKESLQKNDETITKLNSRYEALRAHAQQQIEIANREIDTKKRTFDTEISKLSTQIKRLTIQNKSLNEALVQKKVELEEMNKVYDDLLQVKNIPQI